MAACSSLRVLTCAAPQVPPSCAADAMDQIQVEALHVPQHPACHGCGSIIVATAAASCGNGPPSPAASQHPALVSWDSYRDSASTLFGFSLPASPAMSVPAEQAQRFDMDAYLAAWARLAAVQGCSTQHTSPHVLLQPGAEAWAQLRHCLPAATPAATAAQHPPGVAAPAAPLEYRDSATEHYRLRLDELPSPLRGGSPTSLWIDWTAVHPEDLLLSDLPY